MIRTHADFWTLAASHGIVPSYADAQGKTQHASPEVVIQILRALGVPLERPEDASSVLLAERAVRIRRWLEPVLVHRIGRPSTVVANVPDAYDPNDLWLSIEFEQGHSVRLHLAEVMTGVEGVANADGVRCHTVRLDLSSLDNEPLPAGRHKLTLERAGSMHSALLLSAPACPSARRQTGVFMPIHALRNAADWGVGTYPDLERLSGWAASAGCGLIATLPLYPAFLDPPADPSPYLPVSRLAYNEVFIDPVALPEFAASDEARALCSSTLFRQELASVRSSTLVDYETVARLKRAVLELLAQVATSGALPARREALAEFARRRPELVGYARFRAGLDAPPGEGRSSTLAYHLYCQWAAYEQLVAAGRPTGRYADFPIGSHPAGFDPEWYPDSFIPDLHGGAPPDRFFSHGQDWGFRPLHPARIREDGYAFLSAALHRAFLHSDCLRIDHVMGLERLFMIPEGNEEGAYVGYPTDELHALVALEASRTGSVVVGEDLGTVPPDLRPRMAREGILRTWVFQFESTVDRPMPSPPAQSLVALGTHDLPRFGAYLWGDDIDAREASGLLSTAGASQERGTREQWRKTLFDALGLSETGVNTEKLTAAAFEGCLRHLSASAAAILLVDLQEFWDERGQDNVPGTAIGGTNWRRRSSRTLDDVEADQSALMLLKEITTGRQR